jgi:hypothetical protein
MAKNLISIKERYGRFIGLGQAPSDGLFQNLIQTGFTQVPVIEYVTWTANVPLSDTQINATFGDEIDVLQNPKTVPGIDSVDSSFVINGLLQTDMIVLGFGIHLFGEPTAFESIGNAVNTPGAPISPPGSPDVGTLNDVQALGLPSGSTSTPALLEWGKADWNALWHMANAYQFVWVMQQRYQLINELVADVCYFGPYTEGEGFGTSETDVQQYARQVNNRYRSLAAGQIFQPVNYRRIGSVNTGPAGSSGNVGVFHPTRDFDLVPVSYGGLRLQGAGGCCVPFRKLVRPVLLEKGIPIGMKLIVQDAFHQQQMQRYLSISEGAGTNAVALVQVDQNMTGVVVAATLIMPELTLDATAGFANQRVNTDRNLFKGGTFKAAILIKGYEVWGPWKDYLNQAQSQGLLTGVSGLGAPPGLVPVSMMR